jgi:fermentation-respiration switch protein FrsA (DUF1100 family)
MLLALKWLGIVAVGYLTILVTLYVFQRSLLYLPPQTMRTSPADVHFPQAEEVVLSTSDGENIIAWHVPPRDDQPIVVFLHGNGDSIALRVPRFQNIVSDGTGLLALSFRGYAGSSGSPTEKGLLSDVEAAYDFVAARYPVERIVLWGFSLGTGPAVITAAQRPIGKLILEAPYTSTADVAAQLYPFMPVRLLMKDQYRSDASIAKIKAPLLVMHGDHDQVIPFAMGRKLFDKAPEPKRFVAFPNGTHVDLDRYGAIAVAREFIYGPAGREASTVSK